MCYVFLFENIISFLESNGRSHLEKQRRFEEDFITRQDDTGTFASQRLITNGSQQKKSKYKTYIVFLICIMYAFI